MIYIEQHLESQFMKKLHGTVKGMFNPFQANVPLMEKLGGWFYQQNT